jgi:hypothetical protein
MRGKHLFLFVLFQLLLLYACCQTEKHGIIAELTNKNVIIRYTYAPQLGLDSIATTICANISRKEMIDRLDYLTDSTRVLVYHIILSNNFELRKKYLQIRYVYTHDSITNVTYMFNNLTWWKNSKGEVVFDKQSVQSVATYWKSRDIYRRPIMRYCGVRPSGT